ncbi:MAG TPA: hypothetical protein PKO09_01645 [Anaerolineae bacterium]|nr:hypothetical protein [Anaerolineae bacterium]
MFSKLPEVFHRSFMVGYFVPAAVFVALCLLVANEFGFLAAIDTKTLNEAEILLGTAIIGLVSWFGGICLLATNREVLRLMEGYGQFNPVQLFAGIEQRRYRELKEDISKLDQEYSAHTSSGEQPPPQLRAKRNRLMRKAAERFPDEERWLLPTSFGNTIRAFEVYPRVMYGLESIQGWSRLLAVVPTEYQAQVDDAKAQVDFWINLSLLSLLLVIGYVATCIYAWQIKMLWFPFVLTGIALVTFYRARSAAVEWGDFVKAAFDVFLPALHQKLGVPYPVALDERIQLWRKFSQAIIYRDPERMVDRIILPTKDTNPNGE